MNGSELYNKLNGSLIGNTFIITKDGTPFLGSKGSKYWEVYFPLKVTIKSEGLNFQFDQTNYDCLYVEDQVNKVTYVNLSSHPNISIVASGKFSGCDFVVVQGEHGLVIAHNYVNSKQDGNDPVAQLNELKSTLNKFGSITMKQFKTQGRSVHHGGGYVIGTKVEGTWKFHWIDVNLDGKIGTVANIQDEHWE